MLRVSVQMDSCPGDLRHCELVILRLCGSPLRLHSPVRSGEGHPPDILSHLLRSVCRKYTEKQMKNITVGESLFPTRLYFGTVIQIVS